MTINGRAAVYNIEGTGLAPGDVDAKGNIVMASGPYALGSGVVYVSWEQARKAEAFGWSIDTRYPHHDLVAVTR